MLRPIRLVAEMPFADAGRRIAGGWKTSAIVFSSSGRYLVQSGTSSFGLSGISPGIQSVMCSRAGYLPVIRAARVGEQTVQAE